MAWGESQMTLVALSTSFTWEYTFLSPGEYELAEQKHLSRLVALCWSSGMRKKEMKHKTFDRLLPTTWETWTQAFNNQGGKFLKDLRDKCFLTGNDYCCCYYSEKAMAPHSSTLAWKIPWMEEPVRLQSMGSLRVGHDWATSLSLFHFHTLEKEMATHSSVLAWRIPGAGEPGGLTSMGSHRVGHDWSDLAAAVAVNYLNKVRIYIGLLYKVRMKVKALVI